METFSQRHFNEHHKYIQEKTWAATSPIEMQFKSWALDWELRVFKNRYMSESKIPLFITPDHCQIISIEVAAYHSRDHEQIGQDRFIWSSFANALVNEHRKQRLSLSSKIKLEGSLCGLNRSLYILLWVGYYLKIDTPTLVSDILWEIITCTGNLRFLFSFLPGLGIREYIQLLYNNHLQYEEKLCEEYFNIITAGSSIPHSHSGALYDYSMIFIKFLISQMKTFHQHHGEQGPEFSLVEILNNPILPSKKYSLLTLGILFNDKQLVSNLLLLGASPHYIYFDEDEKSIFTAERLMVEQVNSIVVTRQFVPDESSGKKYCEAILDRINSYMPLLRGSVVRSKMKKADGFWKGEEYMELNPEIADKWGIEYHPQFPSLLQICRVKIRNHIAQMDREILPVALGLLPLPRKVVTYLNLDIVQEHVQLTLIVQLKPKLRVKTDSCQKLTWKKPKM